MSQLIDELRMLIEDEDSADFTDTQINRYLNKYRGYLDEVSLTAENDDYLVWISKYKYLDSVILNSATDTPVTDSYVSDDINGIYKFTVAQTAIYIKANFYDLYKTVSDIWLIRAGKATFSGAVGLGDETIPADKGNKEFCIQKYWDFRESDSNEMERT